MNLLILKKFNNYFNRKIIKYSTLSDYQSASSSYTNLSDINFNPNDGVRTELVLGAGSLESFFDFEQTNSADYLVCYTTEDDTNTIESRWFITEVRRTRAGQYAISLKRDSIADNIDTLISCPAYIRKGVVEDTSPYILNDEGVSVNQIKSGETLLKDASGSAWIVGYMAKDQSSIEKTVQVVDEDVTFVTIESLASDLDIDSTVLDDVLTVDSSNQSYFINDNIELMAYINRVDQTATEYKIRATSQDFLSSFTVGNFSSVQKASYTDFPIKTVNGGNPYYNGSNVLEVSIETISTHKNKLASLWNAQANAYRAQIKANWEEYTSHPFLTKTVYNTLKNLSDNKTIIYKGGKYYNIKVGTVSGPTNTGELYQISAPLSPFSSIVANTVTNWNTYAYETGTFHAGSAGSKCLPYLANNNAGLVYINYNELVASFYLAEVSDASTIPSVTLSMSSTRNVLKDQAYDMFALPANNITMINGTSEYDCLGEYSQAIAMALVQEYTSSVFYDVQLLPYCPIPGIVEEGQLNLTGLTEGYDFDYIYKTSNTVKVYSDEIAGVVEENADLPGYYDASAVFIIEDFSASDITDKGFELSGDDASYITGGYLTAVDIGDDCYIYFKGDAPSEQYTNWSIVIWYEYTSDTPQKKSVILYPTTASFSVNIDKTLSLQDTMKIESQCNFYRLVSPNYQGSFDFNVAKNGGYVDGFIAECTYKPYTPYIKVTPNFGWMYGTNFGDNRGLICGGDFSIGILNDKWQEYELNNKNYQNIFNREIQNLDLNQSIQRTQQYTAGALNIAKDTFSGAAAGGLATGSPWGALAGAAIGGTASAIGYGVDMNLMERSLVEQRQFSLDKFRLQLGNIQALPYTLTKVGAFTINSKIWPFLEYYTCTEEEKTALQYKIDYEGMTVGVIDILGNYIAEGSGNYIQADLIRNDDIIDDGHLLEDIYIELTKGVYI